MFKSTNRTTKIASLLALVIALAVAATASANNGTKTPPSTSTISLDAQAGAATASPTYGSTVHFTVSTTATSYPFVHLTCSQNGTVVAIGWAGYFDGALGTGNFGLYSPQWTGGSANCTASLEMNTSKGWKSLASTDFTVTG